MRKTISKIVTFVLLISMILPSMHEIVYGVSDYFNNTTIRIEGEAEVGNTLTAYIGDEIPSNVIFQWGRSDSSENRIDGAPIDGANDSSYTIQPEDIGKCIYVTIHGDGVVYSAELQSTSKKTRRVLYNGKGFITEDEEDLFHDSIEEIVTDELDEIILLESDEENSASLEEEIETESIENDDENILGADNDYWKAASKSIIVSGTCDDGLFNSGNVINLLFKTPVKSCAWYGVPMSVNPDTINSDSSASSYLLQSGDAVNNTSYLIKATDKGKRLFAVYQYEDSSYKYKTEATSAVQVRSWVNDESAITQIVTGSPDEYYGTTACTYSIFGVPKIQRCTWYCVPDNTKYESMDGTEDYTSDPNIRIEEGLDYVPAADENGKILFAVYTHKMNKEYTEDEVLTNYTAIGGADSGYTLDEYKTLYRKYDRIFWYDQLHPDIKYTSYYELWNNTDLDEWIDWEDNNPDLYYDEVNFKQFSVPYYYKDIYTEYKTKPIEISSVVDSESKIYNAPSTVIVTGTGRYGYDETGSVLSVIGARDISACTWYRFKNPATKGAECSTLLTDINDLNAPGSDFEVIKSDSDDFSYTIKDSDKNNYVFAVYERNIPIKVNGVSKEFRKLYKTKYVGPLKDKTVINWITTDTTALKSAPDTAYNNQIKAYNAVCINESSNTVKGNITSLKWYAADSEALAKSITNYEAGEKYLVSDGTKKLIADKNYVGKYLFAVYELNGCITKQYKTDVYKVISNSDYDNSSWMDYSSSVLVTGARSNMVSGGLLDLVSGTPNKEFLTFTGSILTVVGLNDLSRCTWYKVDSYAKYEELNSYEDAKDYKIDEALIYQTKASDIDGYIFAVAEAQNDYRKQYKTNAIGKIVKSNCLHSKPVTLGYKGPSFIKEGYTGDIYCRECGMLLQLGEVLEPLTCEHNHIVLRNILEASDLTDGYSGDEFCLECRSVVNYGTIIPHLKTEYKISYVLFNGINNENNPSIYKEGTDTKLFAPYKDGYKFIGWYDNPEFTGNPITKIDGNAKKDIVLYANFEAYEGLVIEDIEDMTYTGMAIKPEVNVYYGTKKLKNNIDYKVSYSNNIKANTGSTKVPTAVIKGIGNYEGTYIKQFNINKKDIKTCYYVDEINIANNKTVEPVIINNEAILPAANYDMYLVSGSNETKITKNYKWKESGILRIYGKDNFEGYLDIKINVKALAPKVIAVQLGNEKLIYNSKNQVPKYTVYAKGDNNKTPLTKDKDYIVSIEENSSSSGSHKLLIVGIGEYTGKITKKYTINPNKELSINVVSNTNSVSHNKLGATIDDIKVTTVLDNVETELEEGKDYSIKYSNNKKITTATKKATYTVKFMGDYKGTPSKTNNFDIVEASINQAKVVILDKSGCVENKLYKQKVNLDLDGVLLKLNSDYKVKYYTNVVDNKFTDDKIWTKDNPVVFNESGYGIVTAVISGNNNYVGTKVKEYKVYKKLDSSSELIDLSNGKTTINIVDSNSIMYDGTLKTPKVEVLYKGKVVTESSYYVEYFGNINKGTGYVVVYGDSQNTIGSKQKSFKIKSYKIK